MAKKTQGKGLRFSAKLLFQFRVISKGISNARRVCEQRIIVIEAPTAQKAHQIALDKGRQSEHSYKNEKGAKVCFEFVGIMDLLSLGPECEEGEVWYDLVEMYKPKERAKKILPPRDKLNALYWEKIPGVKKKP